MIDNSKDIYTGAIAMYNGKYGFIKSNNGAFFFHKTGINSSCAGLVLNDEVEFELEPSSKKIGKLQATNIKTIKQIASNYDFIERYDIYGRLIWPNGYIKQDNFYFIAKKLIKDWGHTAYTIFRELTDTKEQEILLEKTINELENLDDSEKFEMLIIEKKNCLNYASIDKTVGANFIKKIASKFDFNLLDDDKKYLLWLNGYCKQITIDIIAKNLINEKTISTTDVYNNLLKDEKVQETLLDNILKELEDVDNTIKFNVLLFIYEDKRIFYTVKTNFIRKVTATFDFTDGLYDYQKYKLWKFGYTNRVCQEYLIKEFKKSYSLGGDKADISLIFSRIKDEKGQIELLNKLQNEIDFTKERDYAFLKYILDDKNLISRVKDEFISNLLKVILSKFMEVNISYSKYQIFLIVDKIKWFEKFGYIKQKDLIQICNLNQFSEIRQWLYGLIEKFDFTTYSYYYFTLNLNERKIFNKKAKEIMKREIKNSELKKREAWRFIEKIKKIDDKEIELYSASWKSIWFNNSYIRICTDKEPHFSRPFPWKFSEEKFNLLYDYISGRKLEELKIEVLEGKILKIEGLDDLEEVIWKILIQQEFKKNGNVTRNIGENRVPVNMIVRNQCVQFLNKLKVDEYAAIMVFEKSFNTNRNSDAVDVSLLFSIPILNKNEVAIIWESLELGESNATHIFKCHVDDYKNTLAEIKFQLQNTRNIRSTLHKIDNDDKKRLGYEKWINHDNFNYSKWEKSLLEVVPELKKQSLFTQIQTGKTNEI